VKKSQAYKWIKIYGLLSYIPIILAVGPLSGFFLGSYLEKKFALPSYSTLIFILFGFISAGTETVRIIRLVSKIDRKTDGTTN